MPVYQAAHIEVIEWNAALCLPTGQVTQDRSEAFDLFVNDIIDAYGRGARFLATLPLLEPGNALVLIAVEDEAGSVGDELASVGEAVVEEVEEEVA
jgi:hypothetical protein